MERQETQKVLVRLKLIGSIEATDLSGNNVLPPSRKARALLSYLALNASWVPRARITRLLWDRVPEEQGRASLRQALHELSKSMGPAFSAVIETERERVRLRLEAVWIDALAVETSGGRSSLDSPPDLTVFSGSLLLDGLDNLSDEFDHWLTLERQKLEERIRRWNETNIRSSAQDPPGQEQRVESARRAVAIDPTNEEAVRELMRALASTGQRAQAAIEFERCRAVLRSRLDLQPAAETQQLHRELRRGASVEQQPAERGLRAIEALHLPLPEVQMSQVGDLQRGYEARPSIAVLPFREDAAGPDQTYFGDGFVDNIIHGLAGLKELIVISRGSTTNYSGKPIDVRAIGRELLVRYVLVGSVQRSTDKLRIGVELTDAESGTVIRANRYDGKQSDLFDLQDLISEDVVKTIAPRVREHELKRALRKHPQNVTAYDLVLQALQPLYRLDYTSFARARGLLQRAMEIDPSYAPAFSYAAYWHIFRVGQEWSTNLASDIAEAARLSELAIACDENDAMALAIFGYVQSYLKKQFDEAFQFFDRAIACGPSAPTPWIFSAATLCFIGDGSTAVDRASTAVRLSPLDSHVFFAEHILAQSHYVNGNFAEAVRWARRADAGNAQLTSNLRTLASSLVAIDKVDEAREVARRHQRIVPTFRVSAWASRTPMQGDVRTLRVERLLVAGMPE